ncbi:predicted protein [Sclerotinia sclerotiorum 1980 UF-70]|uniref:Uncharacterized protein n=1 Tax=Sclerotinia sclerotiorum (strain ATCC 18683 / 1980 / Ss-1) TaxID=665079 RepID=A7EPD3_SCLS1|nr:predicted protein [Sclerotinia sclerotiorum 1980 UF-70]EDO04699.1 predicted protein [Sclerotinia sclerotiorum 1980 UF-70]
MANATRFQLSRKVPEHCIGANSYTKKYIQLFGAIEETCATVEALLTGRISVSLGDITARRIVSGCQMIKYWQRHTLYYRHEANLSTYTVFAVTTNNKEQGNPATVLGPAPVTHTFCDAMGGPKSAADLCQS